MKNKYATSKKVFGILTVVCFALAIIFFFVFGAIMDKDLNVLKTLCSFVVVIFGALGILFSILFIVFIILKSKEDKKLEKKNPSECFSSKTDKICTYCGSTNKKDAKFCFHCGKPFVDENPLFEFTDNTVTKYSTLIKGMYYNSVVAFYFYIAVMLLCVGALITFCILSMPAYEIGIFSVLSFLAIFLFVYTYFIAPAILISKSKKTNFGEEIKVYNDRIVVYNMTNMSDFSAISNSLTVIEVAFNKAEKMKMDKNAYYFIYRNNKNKRVVLTFTYQCIPTFPGDLLPFLNQKMKEINSKK